MQIRWITFLVLGFIFLAACTKELSNQHPVVTFIRPYGDSPKFSSISDTVVFRVSDDKLVHSVSISFVNEDLISLTLPITLNIYSKDTVVEQVMSLGSLDVEKAYLLISANDESQTKLKYQPVILTDNLPTREKIVYGFRENGQTNIGLFDPFTERVTSKQSFDYEVNLLEGNVQSDFILSWPESKRFVEVRAVKEAQTIWRAEAAFPQTEYVDYYLHDENLLLADRNGNLKLHHFYTGNVQLIAQVEAEKLISAVCFDSRYLYAATKDLQTGKNWLLLFFKASGVFYKRFELASEAQEMLSASDSSGIFLIATNENSATQIFSFDIEKELVELESTIPNFVFIPPAALQNEFIYLRNKKQIIIWSSYTLVSQIFTEGTEINGMAASPEDAYRIYYVDENRINFTNNFNLGGAIIAQKLDVIALIKD